VLRGQCLPNILQRKKPRMVGADKMKWEHGKHDRLHNDMLGGTISESEMRRILEDICIYDDIHEGLFLVEADGCTDCQAQAWSLNAGHSNHELIEAAIRQLRVLSHVRTCNDTFPRIRLVQRLSEIAPGNLKKVGLSLGGSQASESAFKLAMVNRPGAREFITLYNAYHGSSLATIAASWTPTQTLGIGQYGYGMKFQPFLNGFLRVPNPYCYRCYFGEEYPNCRLTCAKVLELTIAKGATGPVAGVYLEPLQGVGGQIPCPPEYLREVRSICDKYGVLMMFDEVQTAFGRMGTMFAADYYGVYPDIIAVAKAMSNGWPTGAILADTKLKGFECQVEDAYTFGNNAVIQAATLACIDYIIESDLCGRAKEMGAYITGRLNELQKDYPQIGDVRGPGLHIGVEFVQDPETKEPAIDETVRIYGESLERGVLFGLGGSVKNVLKIKPPLTITKQEADRVLEVFEEVVETVFR
jgi:4-aminobutyrate aminotransferase-like enzyme